MTDNIDNVQDFRNMKIPSWDEIFIRRVYEVSMKSKDWRTKIGTVLVRDNRAFSDGYNGFCRGVNDTVLERYERPLKYDWTEHSERNAIYNAAYLGISTKGSIMYTHGIPCTDCARGTINAGIVEVVLHKEWEDIWEDINNSKWNNRKLRFDMFKEAGIHVRYVSIKNLGLPGYMDGKVFNM